MNDPTVNDSEEVCEAEILAIGLALLLEVRPNIDRFGSISYTELVDGSEVVCESHE